MTKFYKIPELRVDAVKFRRCGAGIDGCLADIVGGGVSSCHILKKSVDSRRGSPELIYSLVVESANAPDGAEELSANEAAELLRGVELEVEPVVGGGDGRPVVIGAGPAGMFAALVLAMAGARPVVLEKGRDVVTRAADIARFFASRRLDESSNYLIGEGGAGTFSDGKLYTRNRDERAAWVLRMFVEGGAMPDVLYLKRPHLGSDRLPGIVAALREKIIALGGEFRFGAEVDDIIVKDGNCRGVRLAGGELLESPAVLFACGLGGRRLVRKLIGKFDYELKGFQVGSRIEHPQHMVDRRQYRCERPETLGAAEYNMVMPPTEARPGVSTFCMCPGGEIIPASAFEGELSSNGMSNYARGGEFANATLVVTPRKLKFPDGDAAFDFLDELGKKTFDAGGGDYTFPAQDAAGFLRGETKLSPGARSSARLGLRAADISALLPREATNSIREALKLFDRKFGGFISAGRFVGVESYISSPVRFVRGMDGMGSAAGFFPCGEGAGMAGGIMSAAVDGIDIAQKMIIFINKKQKSEAVK